MTLAGQVIEKVYTQHITTNLGKNLIYKCVNDHGTVHLPTAIKLVV